MANITAIELQGFDNFINAVKQMPDKMKAKTLVDIMKVNLKPVATSIKANAPVRKENQSQKAIVRKRKDGSISTISEVGNLKKSIGVKGFVGRGEPAAYAGIQKRKNDGWYGWFVERGTKYQTKNAFIQRSAAATVPLASENLQEDIRKYIVKNAQKLGLDSK